MLMDYAPFNRETIIGMEAFLSDFKKPMCFVGKIIFDKYVKFQRELSNVRCFQVRFATVKIRTFL
jgi:hypothetical protein